MVTIGMNYEVLPGKEEVFEKACERVIDAMGGMDGHAESRIFRQVGKDARTYLIVSRWSDEDAFTRFVASDTFKKVTSWGLSNVLAGRPSHTTYRE